MLKKFLFLFVVCTLCIIFLPQLTKPSSSLITVFRLTEQPAVIVKGAQGSALTIDISFGDREVEELLELVEQPYPLLFIDMDWASRFPHITEKMKKRSLPVALLGQKGEIYEENPGLLTEQLKQFEEIFEARPLWFRSSDEQFPQSLLKQLHEAEVNALGSSYLWEGGSLKKAAAGEIIAVPHHREQRTSMSDIERLLESRPFQSVEDLLFQPSIKTKKIPK